MTKVVLCLLDRNRGSHYFNYISTSVIPDGIHTKPRIWDIQMRNSRKELLVPTIDLHEPLLVIGQRQPLVAPIARTHGIRMAAACRSGVETQLPLNIAGRTEPEGGDVAGEVEGVGARGGEEVFAAMG